MGAERPLTLLLAAVAASVAVQGHTAASRTPLVAEPTGRVLTPLAACVVGSASLVVATKVDKGIWVVDLDSGQARSIAKDAETWGLAPADPESFWAIGALGSLLVRMDLQGRVLEHLKLPERVTRVAAVSGGLVLARSPMFPKGLLLLRGRPGSFHQWALPVEDTGGGPLATALAHTVALGSDGQLVAVVWPVLNSELALLDTSGRLVLRTQLPYFAAEWAPLGYDPALLQLGEVSRVPKPYADVAIARGRVYCLSLQEGPWQDSQTRRGRHVVVVALDGRVVAVHQLSVDGCQLAVDAAQRVLVVDRELGVQDVTAVP